MPAPRSHRRVRLSALVSVALAFTGLQLFASPVAQANVSPRSGVPLRAGLVEAGGITADDNVRRQRRPRYRGDNLTVATGTDPQSLTADGSAVTDAIANTLAA